MNQIFQPTFAISPTGSALGAYIDGLDMRKPLAPQTFQRLQSAWQQHHILIFRGQRLSDQELLNFATYFGDVFRPAGNAPVLASDSAGGTPDIVKVANVEGGYTGSGELSAHIDHQWTARPSKASFLHARQVPSKGGDTSWYNLQLAWESLEESQQQKIQKLALITYNPFINRSEALSNYRHPNETPNGEPIAHPLVRTHPETAQKLLYLSDNGAAVEIPGVAYEEGKALIEALRTHIFQAQYCYEHKWSVGDVVLWDNRSTAHYRTAFSANEVRDMRRVSLAGERPL